MNDARAVDAEHPLPVGGGHQGLAWDRYGAGVYRRDDAAERGLTDAEGARGMGESGPYEDGP